MKLFRALSAYSN